VRFGKVLLLSHAFFFPLDSHPSFFFSAILFVGYLNFGGDDYILKCYFVGMVVGIFINIKGFERMESIFTMRAANSGEITGSMIKS